MRGAYAVIGVVAGSLAAWLVLSDSGGTGAGLGSEDGTATGSAPAPTSATSPATVAVATEDGSRPGDPAMRRLPAGARAVGGSDQVAGSEAGAPPLHIGSGFVRDSSGAPVRGVEITTVFLFRDLAFPLDLGGVTSDAGGGWRLDAALPLPPAAGSPDRVRVRYSARSTRHRQSPAFVEVPIGATDVVLTVEPLPALRLQILDAVSRQPIPDADAGMFMSVERQPPWLTVFFSTPEKSIRLSAPHYIPRVIAVAPPEAGVATHPEPVLLEAGWVLAGVLALPEGIAAGGAMVVAESLDAPGTFERASAGEGRFRFEPMRPGRYRLLAFAVGCAPAQELVALTTDNEAHPITLRARGAGGPPAERTYPWTERRELQIPISTTDVPAMELLEWLEALGQTRIARDAEVEKRLGATRVSSEFTGAPLHLALALLAELNGFEFDDETGALRVGGG